MIQKTTPELRFDIKDIDLTGYEVYVYIKQFNVSITKENPAVTVEDGDSVVITTLTEAESLSLYAGTAYAQVWARTDGNTVATEAIPFEVGEILNREFPNEG